VNYAHAWYLLRSVFVVVFAVTVVNYQAVLTRPHWSTGDCCCPTYSRNTFAALTVAAINVWYAAAMAVAHMILHVEAAMLCNIWCRHVCVACA
jgi:hypothetical protein